MSLEATTAFVLAGPLGSPSSTLTPDIDQKMGFFQLFASPTKSKNNAEPFVRRTASSTPDLLNSPPASVSSSRTRRASIEQPDGARKPQQRSPAQASSTAAKTSAAGSSAPAHKTQPSEPKSQTSEPRNGKHASSAHNPGASSPTSSVDDLMRRHQLDSLYDISASQYQPTSKLSRGKAHRQPTPPPTQSAQQQRQQPKHNPPVSTAPPKQASQHRKQPDPTAEQQPAPPQRPTQPWQDIPPAIPLPDAKQRYSVACATGFPDKFEDAEEVIRARPEGSRGATWVLPAKPAPEAFTPKTPEALEPRSLGHASHSMAACSQIAQSSPGI